MYSIDVKDAFPQVPQRTKCACEFPNEYVELFGEEDPDCRTEGLLLYVCCQDSMSQRYFGAITLLEALRNRTLMYIACPSLFRDNRNSILVAPVDDIQTAGKSTCLSKLGETYELKVEGPFLTQQELAVAESHQTI